MKKRLLALTMVLALLIACVPGGVLAEGTDGLDPAQTPEPLAEDQEETTEETIEETTEAPVIPAPHSHSGEQHDCEHCDEAVEWIAWGDDEAEKTSLPNDSNHYYLAADIKVAATTDVNNSADLVLCLNGYTIDAGQKCYIYRVGTNGSTTDRTKVTVSDCTAYTDADDVYHAGALMNGKGKDGGGAFFLRGASGLYMYAGKLTGHQNTQTATGGYGGGAITSRNSATICLENVEISNCSTSAEGGAIGARNTVQITLKNVVFKNNSATKDGGAISLSASGNVLRAADCVFEGNTAAARGGAICAVSGSSVTINGGKFHKNTAATLGGAIYANASDVTVTGTAESYVQFTENRGEGNSNGGAILATGACDLSLQYVKMTGNTVRNSGGSAIMLTGGAMGCVSDATFTGNANDSTGTFRGTVYVTGTTSVLTLSGKVIIKDNEVADLYVQNNNTDLTKDRTNDDCWVVVNGLTEGSEIVLDTHTSVAEDETLLNRRIIDGQPENWTKGWIVYSANNMAVDYDQENDRFFFNANTNHLHCDCGDGTDANCDHTENAYLPWTDAAGLPGSGTICLETDVVLSENVRIEGELKLCLNGHTVSVDYATQGDTRDRIFTMNSDDKLTLSDCTAKTADGVYTAGKLTGSSYTAVMVANNTGKDDEGNEIVNSVVIDFYDGIFTGNRSSAGAAFSIQDGATLNMYGGEISGNHSTKYGGAIYVGTQGNFHMYGGTITGNTADGNGTVYVDDSVLSLYGGKISGNTAAAGAGVYVNRTPVTMGGTPVILGNTAGGNASNLYIMGTTEITFDALGEGEGQVSVGADSAPRYLSADMGETDVSKYFTVDSQYRVLEVKENKLYLNYTSDHGHCDCGGGSDHCDHAETAWAPWESSTTLPTSEGYYYLLSDVTLSTYAEFSTGDVHLCLNGHTVSVEAEEGTKYDRIYTIQKDAGLTISDCTAKEENGVYTAGKLTGATAGVLMILNQTASGETNNVEVNFYDGIITGNTVTGTGGILTVQDLAVFHMYGGEISGNTGKLDSDNAGGMGAAFYAGSNGVVNIYDGTITGNTCEGSGTVYVTGNSTLNMYGGTITGNTVALNGGAVLLNGSETVMTMSGGTISGNSARNAGGILAQAGATLNLQGGTITGNTATASGGGVFISTNSVLTMTGGEITGNAAESYAGGIYLFGATAAMSGGRIANNTAPNGAGISARLGERTVDGKKVTDVPSVVTMTGGAITGNKAATVGGGVFTHGAGTTFNLEGGEISDNESASGGGVITQWNSVFNLKSGKITGNTAKNGAGLYGSYTTFLNQEGGEISNNTASANGGGIYSLGSELNLTGGKISGNYAKSYGGGIYTSKYTRFTGTPNEITYTTELNLKGVNVTGNSAGAYGGGICANNKAVVNMTAGSVSGNTAVKAAGGILLQSKSAMNLTGGSISYNHAKSGGGLYISTDCSLYMYGGSVSYNTSTGNCAGLYLLKAEAVLGGGSVSNNSTDATAGGIYMAGSQVKLCGTNVTGNTAKGNGAGICTTKRTTGGKDYYTNITMTGGTISGNVAQGAGGGILLQSYTTMTLKDGIIEKNHAVKDGGGIYVSTNCTFTMEGGEIRYNTADKNGAGLYNLRSTNNYLGGKILGNTATGNGGAVVMSGEGYVVTMKEGIVITGNTAMNGGAIVVQGKVTLNMENVDLTDNLAATGSGGAIYLSSNSFLNITGGSITNHSCDSYGGAIFTTTNSTLNMDGTTISGNKAGYGGALSLGGTAYIANATIADNEATEEGGGIYCHKLLVGGLFENHLVTIEDSLVESNKAGKQGGGVYVRRGSKTVFDGLTVQNNTAGLEGGGLYVVDDTAMYNMTVTGNTSGGAGYALYLADSEYDGESYFIGIFKLGGQMQVTGNTNGDMYFGEQTAAAVDHMGLTGDTRMNIKLHSGYLTQVLQGTYGYEGGNLEYVVTTGDRSVTDPEYDAAWNDRFKTEEPTEEPTEAPADEGNGSIAVSPILYVVIGAAVVVIAAVIAIIAAVAKKKKTAGKK